MLEAPKTNQSSDPVRKELKQQHWMDMQERSKCLKVWISNISLKSGLVIVID